MLATLASEVIVHFRVRKEDSLGHSVFAVPEAWSFAGRLGFRV